MEGIKRVGAVTMTKKGGPAIVDQDDRYKSRKESVWQGNCANICSWRTEVLVAEAKKAGAASEVTGRIPRPPCLIGIWPATTEYQREKNL